MTLKTIQRGTTLGKMVAAHNKEFGTNLTVDQVAKANGLKDANKIVAGKQMLFPDKFEKNAPQSVFQNGDNKPVVRNGVNETVTVNAQPELISTQSTPVSTSITPRPLEKLPAKPEATKTSAQPELISTQNTPMSTNITPRPLKKMPAKPELISTDSKVSSTFTPRPLEKTPETPETKTTLSLTEFLAANKDQKLSVDSLRKKGMNAASSDLNGDGVVSGQKELTSLFAAAEKADSNKDKNVADLTNTTVAKNFENISGAERLTTAPYSATDLERVSDTLREGSADRLGTVNPQMAKQLGLSPGSTEFTVSTSVDETRGMGNRTNSVTIYRDAKSGEYFKEYNNDADGKNTPMVPLTAAEKELVRQLDASRLSGSTPNQQAMMNELFSFDGDM